MEPLAAFLMVGDFALAAFFITLASSICSKIRVCETLIGFPKIQRMMSGPLAYLIGLIAGRGHILEAERRIIIEFAHAKEPMYSIPRCKCGNMASKPMGSPKGSSLICKGCGRKVPQSAMKEIYQRDSIKHSLTTGDLFKQLSTWSGTSDSIASRISGNAKMTLLILDFRHNSKIFQFIIKQFKSERSYDTFEIPDSIIRNKSRLVKIEFVNGILDTAGKFNRGNWLQGRKGKSRNGRYRGYIQLVRNWKMPVQVCNLLKSLDLPIQTIRWGHPHMVDGDQIKTYEIGPQWGFKEHQLKFFPEYYDEITLRIPHQALMFEEMVSYNKGQFTTQENCSAPSGVSKIRAPSPEINSTKIPEHIRGVNIDKFWQICHMMDCTQTSTCFAASKNEKLLFLTGKESGNLNNAQKERDVKRQDALDKIIDREKKNAAKKAAKPVTRAPRQKPEEKLYEPIANWLSKDEKLAADEVTYDTSVQTMDQYLKANKLTGIFPGLADFNQKPDVVGLRKNDGFVVFIEVKAGSLSLTDLGQLLGYCMMADPDRAILISPSGPSGELALMLSSVPGLLEFGAGKRIQVGEWDDKKGFMDGGF